MSYIPSIQGLVDTNNSTTSPLGIGGVYTGTAIDVSKYQTIIINSFSDVASANNGVAIQFANTSGTPSSEFKTFVTYTASAGNALIKKIPVVGKYFRLTYTNGGTAQTTFRLQTLLQTDTSNIQLSQTTTTSVLNSSITQITNGGTFTGQWENIQDYSQIIINIKIDRDISYQLEFSYNENGTPITTTFGPYSLTANDDIPQLIAPVGNYFRVIVSNNSGATTTAVQIYTKFSQLPCNLLTTRLNSEVKNNAPVTLNRSVLTCQTSSGLYKNALIDNIGALSVSNTTQTTAFGELSTAQPTPEAQILFTYGINPNLCTTGITNSGTINTTINGLASISSAAGANSTAFIKSKRQLVYRTGQGGLGRFTCIFSSPTTTGIQIAGMGTDTNGYFFGYNGSNFGINHRNSAGTSVWIPQTTWNIDKMDGSNTTVTNPSGMTLVPTNGNVFQIQFQYLGFGAIKFFIEDDKTGIFTLVHKILYANLNVVPNLGNPNLSLYWKVDSGASGGVITIKTASGALFIEGMKKWLGPRYGKSVIKTLSGLSVVNPQSIFRIRNKITINTANDNKSQLKLRNISFSGIDDNKVNQIYSLSILNNANIATENFQSVSTNSIAEIDETTIVLPAQPGGVTNIELFNAVVADSGNMFMDLTELDIFINPGEILTFVVAGTLNIPTIGLSCCWSEAI